MNWNGGFSAIRNSMDVSVLMETSLYVFKVLNLGRTIIWTVLQLQMDVQKVFQQHRNICLHDSFFGGMGRIAKNCE
jgi:hypothetical protein